MTVRLALALALLAAGPAAAGGGGRVVAGTPNRYLTPDVTIAAGEGLAIANQDVVRHDVTAEDAGASGEPRFRSPLVDPGGEAPVAGAERLPPGDYRFLCSVHSSMRGTLHVTGASPEPAPGQSADTTSPALTVRVRGGSPARRLRVAVATDEPASVALVARARVHGHTLRLGRTDLRSEAGERTATIRVTRRGRAALRHVRRTTVRVSATATDAAGNEAHASARRRMRG